MVTLLPSNATDASFAGEPHARSCISIVRSVIADVAGDPVDVSPRVAVGDEDRDRGGDGVEGA